MSETKRGFAAMDKAKQREIASRGGRASHQNGNAHEFSSDEAREAGRKGGIRVSQNREHMAAIGRRGGERSRGSRRGSAPAENVQAMPAAEASTEMPVG